MTQNEKKLTRKERRNAPLRYGPLDTPELRVNILRLLRQGVTMTEMCARDDMPPLSTLFEMRRIDPAFGAAFAEAMAEHAETLISDAMDQGIAAVDARDEPVNDPVTGEPVRAGAIDEKQAKAAEFYLNSALKYAGAVAPHKYGTLLKVADAQIGHGVQISITSYATTPREQGLEGVPDTGSTPPLQGPSSA